MSFWYDARFRAFLAQAATLAGAVAILGLIVHNTMEQLAARGILSGFDFLWSSAGFGISSHLIEYSEASTYARAFVVGLLNTCFVAVVAIIGATVLGFAVGVGRLSHNGPVRMLATLYVETLRNVPLLLQIFLWYFAILVPLPSPRQSLALAGSFFLNNRGLYLPSPVPEPGFAWALLVLLLAALAAIVWKRHLTSRRSTRARGDVTTGILLAAAMAGAAAAAAALLSWQRPELQGFNFTGGWVLIPEFVALWLALSTYTAAYVAEIVRAGIQAVSPGQREAASALGLNASQTLRLVIIPQALRVIIPPLCGQYLNLTKNSSLGVAIGYPELVSVFAGTVLNQTGQAIEVIGITMAVYLALSLTISLFMNWYNHRVAIKP